MPRAAPHQLEMPQPQAYAYAQEVMALNALAADAHEGICAFLDKRPARWSDRAPNGNSG